MSLASYPKKETFPISNLPAELRHLIYECYFSSLSPLTITPVNARHPHHLTHSLALASFLFARDIVPRTFYRNTTLSFSDPETLVEASETVQLCDGIRKVRIEYGEIDNCEATPDWVFLVFVRFEKIEELEFVVTMGDSLEGLLRSWWGCVVDAVREGVGSRGGCNWMVVRVKNEDGIIVKRKRVRSC